MTNSEETELPPVAPKLSFREYAKLLGNPFFGKEKRECWSMYGAAIISIESALHRDLFCAGVFAGLAIADGLMCLEKNTHNEIQKDNLRIGQLAATAICAGTAAAAVHYNIDGVANSLGHFLSTATEIVGGSTAYLTGAFAAAKTYARIVPYKPPYKRFDYS